MKSKIAIKSFIAMLACLSLSNALFGQDKGQKAEETKKRLAIRKEAAGTRPPAGANFYIGRIEEQPYKFSLLMTDENNRNVYHTVTLNQLILFESVLLEAQRFAETEEAVGTKKPAITRFVDKQEPAFLVDVSKLNRESHIYVTLQGMNGRVTVGAGKIVRGDKDKNEDKLLLKMLNAIAEIKSEGQPQ